MDNEMLFEGLFHRLHGSGLHPVLSGELAAANYPTDEHKPLRAVRCRQEGVHWHTEEYLDKGTVSLEETWLSIWGVTPFDYLGVAEGSPGARELGLAPQAVAAPEPADFYRRIANANPTPVVHTPKRRSANDIDGATFDDAFWFRRASPDSKLRLYSGSALPSSAPTMAQYFANLMCLMAGGVAGALNASRSGYQVAGFHRKPPPGWIPDTEAVGAALAIFLLTAETDCNLLITGPTGDYYRNALGAVHPYLAEFVCHEEEDGIRSGSAMINRITLAAAELADRRRVKIKKNRAELMVEIMGGYVATRGVADVPLPGSQLTLNLALQRVAGAS